MEAILEMDSNEIIPVWPCSTTVQMTQTFQDIAPLVAFSAATYFSSHILHDHIRKTEVAGAN